MSSLSNWERPTYRQGIALFSFLNADTSLGSQASSPRTDPLFRNVTHLALTIDREWPLGSVEYLPKFVDLSKLVSLLLNINIEYGFFWSQIDEIMTLLKRASHARSLGIHSKLSERMRTRFLNVVCLKLPRHIIHLHIYGINMEEITMVFERAEHLSSVKFSCLPHKLTSWNVTKEIIELLWQMRRDSTHWADDFSLYIRLGKKMEKPCCIQRTRVCVSLQNIARYLTATLRSCHIL